MEEKLLQIINHYGCIKQQRELQEEIFELREAIIDYEILKPGEYKMALEEIEKAKDHIVEEIADVQFMLNQFKRYYGIKDEEVKNIMIKKIERQLERIKGETC